MEESAFLRSLSVIANLAYSVLPATFLTFLSLYFGFKKIGHKIAIRYSLVGNRYSKIKISNIVVINKKDRVEVIGEISVRFGTSYRLSLCRFDEPHVLRPFEMIRVQVNDVTDYVIGNESIDLFPLVREGNVVFEIHTDSRVIEVKAKPKRPSKRRLQKEYPQIGIVRDYYNGVVINESVLYAIIYHDGDNTKTAFIDEVGVIGGQWNFVINGLQKKDILDKETVRKVLAASGFASFVKTWEVVDLRESYWKKTGLRKRH